MHLPVPRGEGIGGGASVAVESGGPQPRRGYFHPRWERGSLSPRERARVRGNDASSTPKIVQMTTIGKASDKVSAGTANLRLPGEGQFF